MLIKYQTVPLAKNNDGARKIYSRARSATTIEGHVQHSRDLAILLHDLTMFYCIICIILNE